MHEYTKLHRKKDVFPKPKGQDKDCTIKEKLDILCKLDSGIKAVLLVLQNVKTD